MKTLLLSLALLAAAVPTASAETRTYSQARTDLDLLLMRGSGYRKTLRDNIRQQSNNYEVRRQLENARTNVDLMIKNNNIAKACKVVELGVTAATLGVGGVAAAGAKGLDIMTREGMKQAAKYIGGKGAVEVAKETAGVPGYSDAVKAGVFVFNKYTEDELRSQLGRGDMDLLLRAKKLLEDETGDRTLEQKLPELRELLREAEDRIEKADNQIKGAASNIDNTIREAAALTAEVRRLRDEERKKEKEAYEAARKKEPAKRIQTDRQLPAEVPQPAAPPDESAQERRKRIQEALDRYTKSLAARLQAQQDAAGEAWKSVKGPAAPSPGEPGEMRKNLSELENGLAELRTYAELQNLEYFARGRAEAVQAYRTGLEPYRAEVKGTIEPLITKMAEIAGQWRTVYNTYKPQGFFVAAPPEIEQTTAWTAYYESPLSFIEKYTAETEGLASAYTGLASQAASRKDAVYAEIRTFVGEYAAKAREFMASAPGEVKRIQAALDAFNKRSGPVTDLPHQFALQFGQDGKRDLAALEPLIASAKRDFSAAQNAHMSASLLFFGLEDKRRRLEEAGSDPLLWEARAVAGMAKNAAHKAEMEAALKPLADWRPRLDELSGLESFLPQALENISGIVFDADGALRYLRAAEKRMLAAADAGLSGQKANYSGDLSRLKTASDEEYGRAMEDLAKPYNTAMEKLREVEEEVRSTFLFDPAEELKPQKLAVTNPPNGPMVQGKEPLLFRTGFFPASVAARTALFEKQTADFWDSAAGRELSEARRGNEVRQAQDRRDPGAAIVRKMYADFAQAYQGRNAAKVMQFIAEDWTAGDGTAAADLEEQFRNIFRVYDEITVSITGLQVVNNSPGSYAASYNMAIKSRIYKKNIRREENSSVYETVAVEGNSARIKKTESGGYWEIK